MTRVACLLLVTTATACKIDAGGGTFLCSDGVCPAGQVCVEGVCRVPGTPDAAPGDPDATVPGADADPGAPDAAPPDAAPPPGACGTVAAFTDDFDDGVRDDMWDWSFANPGTTRSETGGHLVITPPAGQASGAYAGYQTGHWFDLRDARVFVEVPVMVSTTTRAQAVVHLRDGSGGGDRLSIVQENGTLYFQRRLGGTTTTVASILYDPVAHRWWALSESGGMIRWETAPDGAAWTMRAEAVAPSLVAHVRLELSGGTYQAETAPGSVHFDNFNGGGPALAGFCPAATVSDDFEDGAPGVTWSNAYDDPGCTYMETGGRLVLTLTTGTTSWCGYHTGQLHDLRDSSVTVEMPVVPSVASDMTGLLALVAVNGDYLELYAESGEIGAARTLSGSWSSLDFAPYDATAHRWLRVRETAGMVHFETSPDGAAWSLLTSTPPGIDTSRIDIVLAGGADTAGTVDGVAAFDNLN